MSIRVRVKIYTRVKVCKNVIFRHDNFIFNREPAGRAHLNIHHALRKIRNYSSKHVSHFYLAFSANNPWDLLSKLKREISLRFHVGLQKSIHLEIMTQLSLTETFA